MKQSKEQTDLYARNKKQSARSQLMLIHQLISHSKRIIMMISVLAPFPERKGVTAFRKHLKFAG